MFIPAQNAKNRGISHIFAYISTHTTAIIKHLHSLSILLIQYSNRLQLIIYLHIPDTPLQMLSNKCLHLYLIRFTFMNKRLQQFLELENLSPARLADLLGVQRSGMSHILSGRNKPGFDFIQKLLNKFPDLSADWFITGKGKPYKERNTSTSQNNWVNQPNGSGQNIQHSQPAYQDRTPNQPSRDFTSQLSGQSSRPYMEQLPSSAASNLPENNYTFIQGQTSSQSWSNGPDGNVSQIFDSRQEQILSGETTVDAGEETDIFMENIFPDGISVFSNSQKEELQSPDNSSNFINYQNGEELNNHSYYQERNATILEKEGFTDGSTGDFGKISENGENSAGTEILEINANTTQNTIQQPYNQQINHHKRASYPRENQINYTNKVVTHKNKSVKRVIIFYSDGSFDELFPGK